MLAKHPALQKLKPVAAVEAKAGIGAVAEVVGVDVEDVAEEVLEVKATIGGWRMVTIEKLSRSL
jgi:hypothetical protein